MQSRWTNRRKLLIFSLMAITLINTGCGKEEKKPWETGATLEGKVILDDKPFGAGIVVLLGPEGKRRGAGKVRPDGTFTVLNAPIGKVKVGVRVRDRLQELQNDNAIQQHLRDPSLLKEMKKAAQEGDEQMASQLKDAEDKLAEYNALKKLKKAPAISYEKPEDSGLEIEIKEGKNTQDIKLSSR